MLPYFSEHFANPFNVYDMGSKIKQIVDEHRAKVANLIGAKAEELPI
jgi:cysteine desulfurase